MILTVLKRSQFTKYQVGLVAFVLVCSLVSEELAAVQDGRGGVANLQLRPNWIDEGAQFWFKHEMPRGRFEFLLIDPADRLQRPLFDHQRLAEALKAADVDATANRLPIDNLKFDATANSITFRAGNQTWIWSNATNELQRATGEMAASLEGLTPHPPAQASRLRQSHGEETYVTFVNQTDTPVELFWISSDNRRTSYGTIAANDRHRQHTFAGHVWMIVGQNGRDIVVFQAEAGDATANILSEYDFPRPQRRGAAASNSPRRQSSESPDGKWRFEIRDYNLFVTIEETGETVQVSNDGSSTNYYTLPQWSPNSQALVASRMRPAQRQQVHLIESSPADGGRAKLQSRNYDLPGDPFDEYEINLFVAPDWKQIRPEVDKINFGRFQPRWRDDGRRLVYRQVDRGHQRFRIVDMNVATGEYKYLVDETTDTFIWTAHGSRPYVHELESGDIIYGSERDGWHHLYLIDGEAGGIKNQITQKEFVVRRIESVDESAQQILFQASGVFPDQDPYLLHFCRVNFDGTGMTILTEGHGNHTIQFSPDGKYFVDTWSRVDQPPVHELRSAVDGALVMGLARAEFNSASGESQRLPEVFSAAGRDGKTSIWGVIYRPRNLDPNRKYPVIEYIYAGPHDSHVPKSFQTRVPHQRLTELGFIVVQIDGMGTANRSKAFHDVCWHNLKDAGFPDRILWHQAVAQQYPYYDTDRVGIFGTSAGGQNAAGAVLFHGDVYKAAYASCGCHDNRMDKASWNEQWMGYPVGPHYAESSNNDNAHRLQGKLMLVVGELDTNVPPESTLRFVDALVKANKDFEFLLIPGMGHSDGGAYGRRRMEQFFIQHLHPE